MNIKEKGEEKRTCVKSFLKSRQPKHTREEKKIKGKKKKRFERSAIVKTFWGYCHLARKRKKKDRGVNSVEKNKILRTGGARRRANGPTGRGGLIKH